MKRSFAAALCAAGLLASMACGVYALSREDSLISLRYITDLFLPGTVEQGRGEIEDSLQGVYDDAAEDLEQVQDELMEQATGSAGRYSPDLRPNSRNGGDILTMETGAGFMLYSGAARVSHDGAFIDVTDGSEVPSGTELVSGHRYLVGEDTIADVVVLSGLAQAGVQGGYQLLEGKKDLPFYDVRTDDWFYDAVAYVYEDGLFSGVGDGKFAPELTMNRAMLMTGLYRLAGSPAREMEQASIVYTDVPDTAWYSSFVRWAGTQGITGGIGNNKFGPDLQLTREQVVTLLHSFATNYMGKTLDGRANIEGYSDYEQSSGWARQSLAWAVHYGVLDSSWAGENTLGGHQLADRAEVSAMLAAFAENIL